MKLNLRTRCAAEFLGTCFLVAAVIGSGIRGERLSGGNVAIALLANTIATGAALVALIQAFAAISGAHFNPIVTVAIAITKNFDWKEVPPYMAAQCVGGIAGAMTAHIMFGLHWYSLSVHSRHGWPMVFSEFVATFGLLMVIFGCSGTKASAIPYAVGCYITAAYWFTASTSFANPAVTIARCISDTFAGIRPQDVLPFIAAQFVGGLAASFLFPRWQLQIDRNKSVGAPSGIEPELQV